MRCIARAVVMNSSDQQAIFVCGPTAVGKTTVAIELAEWLNTEIISFDSRQIYLELKIGSAPPAPEELARVPHHFIASHSLSDSLSAAEFATTALELMERLYQKHTNLVLAGGSGLYMKALSEGLDDIPKVPSEIRESLNNQFEEEGLSGLQRDLKRSDPEYFAIVDLKNPQRLIRALEVIRHTGKPFSSFHRGKPKRRSFKSVKIGLDMPREILYDRINKRVDAMIAAGLETEVKSLEAFWSEAALKTVGYDELVHFFRGETDRETAIEEIKKHTRRYAKRQLTWFRRDPEIKWFNPQDIEEMKGFLSSKISVEP